MYCSLDFLKLNKFQKDSLNRSKDTFFAVFSDVFVNFSFSLKFSIIKFGINQTRNQTRRFK